MSVRGSARGTVPKVRVVPKSKDGETTVHAEKAALAKAQVHEVRRVAEQGPVQDRCRRKYRSGAPSGLPGAQWSVTTLL